MSSTITVWITEYHPWQEEEDEPLVKSREDQDYYVADFADAMGDWDSGEWIPASPVDVAVALLTGSHHTDFYAEEASSGPDWSLGTWYASTDHHVYTGARTDKSAHLSGFTPAEEREIYERVTASAK